MPFTKPEPANPEYGYTDTEVEQIGYELHKAGCEVDKYHDALRGCTGRLKDGVGYTYTCDVDKAIRCAISGMGLSVEEWD